MLVVVADTEFIVNLRDDAVIPAVPSETVDPAGKIVPTATLVPSSKRSVPETTWFFVFTEP